MTTSILDILKERTLIEATTSDDILQHLSTSRGIYAGFDPTADSLHLGHMLPLIVLSWFQKHGHRCTAVAGGATGLIGDPGGKSQERPLLDKTTLQKNLKGIQRDISLFLDFNHPTAKAQLLNNYSWFEKIEVIDFLRDVGKFFRLGVMLSKDSVKTRLESPEGMSFTEFSYQLLQGFDFLHLFNEHQVSVQIGGSDQWGNIVAGTDLIRKKTGETAFGITLPLLTKSDGKKFGKSEQGAVWLCPEKLSPYDFYQYLYRTNDADVIMLMRRLTFLPMTIVHEWELKMASSDYEPNTAQKQLAQCVTEIVHGEKGVLEALTITQQAKPGAHTNLDATNLESLATQIPSFTYKEEEFFGKKIIDLMASSQLCASKAEARRLIQQGGLSLNNEKCHEENQEITTELLLHGKWILIGLGKKKKALFILQR